MGRHLAFKSQSQIQQTLQLVNNKWEETTSQLWWMVPRHHSFTPNLLFYFWKSLKYPPCSSCRPSTLIPQSKGKMNSCLPPTNKAIKQNNHTYLTGIKFDLFHHIELEGKKRALQFLLSESPQTRLTPVSQMLLFSPQHITLEVAKMLTELKRNHYCRCHHFTKIHLNDIWGECENLFFTVLLLASTIFCESFKGHSNHISIVLFVLYLKPIPAPHGSSRATRQSTRLL